jgi:hypothetical protein
VERIGGEESQEEERGRERVSARERGSARREEGAAATSPRRGVVVAAVGNAKDGVVAIGRWIIRKKRRVEIKK